MYKHIATIKARTSLACIVSDALSESPDNPVKALETVLQKTITIALHGLKEASTLRESTLYDEIFRLYLSRHLEEIYSFIFHTVTPENAKEIIQKKNDTGEWVPLSQDEWSPIEKSCMDRLVRYSRISLSTILSDIPMELIAFVFLPLQSKVPANPTETPIHDHSAPCTGALILQDSKSFSLEDRFRETRNASVVDFEKKRHWSTPFQPVTDLKNNLHPNVIHRVSYHSYESEVTPALRIHIYGSKTPNRKMDYLFTKRAFNTDDIPENHSKKWNNNASFFGGISAHEV
jgi:hypothetical protein